MTLHRTWGALVALSFLTAALTAGSPPRVVLVIGVLLLAGLKARLILRHYLDMEQGNLFRALGRYNGSLGKPDYPNRVRASWQHWFARASTDGAHPEGSRTGREPADVDSAAKRPTTSWKTW